MNSAALVLSALCAISISGISLSSSGLFKKNPNIPSELLAFVSFLPGFLIASYLLFFNDNSVSSINFLVILFKNILYGASFYLRYESLKKFGPFVGAMLLGAQPVLLSLASYLVLDEKLNTFQSAGIVVVTIALFFLASQKSSDKKGNVITSTGFFNYFLAPMAISIAVIIIDRAFLKDQMNVNQYFAIDRFTMLPAFYLAMLFLQQTSRKSILFSLELPKLLNQYWRSFFLIGLLFTTSIYAYTFALKLESAALVGLMRNSSYPIAAIVGIFLFHQKISKSQWIGFLLLTTGILLSIF